MKNIVLFICLFCSVKSFAQKPDFNWVGKIGRTDEGYPSTIITDRSANVYTVGTFKDTGDFDPGIGVFKLPNSVGGNQNMYICKLDSYGDFIWAKSFGGTSNQNLTNVVISDSNGYIYLAGRFSGIADFSPGAAVTNFTAIGAALNLFIIKLDTSGNLVWARTFGSTSSLLTNEAMHMTIDRKGNVYTTGKFSGNIDFDPGPGVFILSAEKEDIFISKLDKNGDFVWAKKMGGADNDVAYSIAVDDSFSIYTTGSFQNKADFDPSAATYLFTDWGRHDAFISKLDSNGNFVWAKQLTASDGETGRRIACDNFGDVIITGFVNNEIDMDPGPGVYNLKMGIGGSPNYFLLKLKSNGDFVWGGLVGNNSYGGSGVERVDIALDKEGNIFMTAPFGDSSDFDPDTLNVFMLNTTGGRVVFPSGLVSNDADIFIAKINRNGSFGWVKGIGGRKYDLPLAICLDDSGAIYSAGAFSDTVDFDPGPDSTFLIAGPPYARYISEHAGGYVLKLSPCKPTYSILNINACNSFTLNSINYTNSGTFTQKQLNSTGCDSLITLNLSLEKIDKNVTLTSTDLIADEAAATAYQWLDCNNSLITISGATAKVFSPPISGSYAVALTKGICTDTSLCVMFDHLGIENQHTESLNCYPNPSNGFLNIELEKNYPFTKISVSNILGQIVQTFEYKNSQTIQLNFDGPKGIYLISLDHGNTQKRLFKMVKN